MSLSLMFRNGFMILGLIFLLVFSPEAGAQERSGFVDARNIARVAASDSPVVGEVVISQNGDVAPYFKKVETCNVQGCRVFIYDNRTGALINNDGTWSSAYARTGVGQEVIRVKAFSEAERPANEPASDQALRSAPRVRVKEPPGQKEQ